VYLHVLITIRACERTKIEWSGAGVAENDGAGAEGGVGGRWEPAESAAYSPLRLPNILLTS